MFFCDNMIFNIPIIFTCLFYSLQTDGALIDKPMGIPSPTPLPKDNSSWLQTELYLVKHLWKECTNGTTKGSFKKSDRNQTIFYEEVFPMFMDCVKRRALTALDRILELDVIPLYDGIKLVRFQTKKSRELVPEEKVSKDTTWLVDFTQRIMKIFKTHVVKVDVDLHNTPAEDARRRRHRHSVLPIFIFGTLAMVLILIPMGFKFLAVLGGKALLLAKMALILASIQGLKRIATSSVNYGLYHVPVGPPGAPGWHDRHSRVEYQPYIYETESNYYDKSNAGIGPTQDDVQMTIG